MLVLGGERPQLREDFDDFGGHVDSHCQRTNLRENVPDALTVRFVLVHQPQRLGQVGRIVGGARSLTQPFVFEQALVVLSPEQVHFVVDSFGALDVVFKGSIVEFSL